MTAILASLLPNGEQQFIDANGAPYEAGLVYFYIPGTTTLKTTWLDPFKLAPNTNPVVLDAAGRAIIYGDGQYRQVLYDADGVMIWDKLTNDTLATGSGSFGAQESIASATTTDLGSLSSNNVLVTGTIEIDSFGTSASTESPLYLVTFAAALKLNYDATSMVLPGARDIETAAGDSSFWLYEDSGDWTCIAYFPATGLPLLGAFGPEETIASATTTDLGALPSNNSLITGTTTIAALGASATLLSPVFITKFQGALTLTHSATLVLPGSTDIITTAGDCAMWQYLGSSTWQLMFYQSAAHTAVTVGYQSFLSNASGAFSYTLPAGVTPQTRVKITAIGGGGAGSANGGTANQGGGGGGCALLSAYGFQAGQAISGSVGAGGAGGAGTTGNAGSATTVAYNAVTIITANGGAGGVAASGGGLGGTVVFLPTGLTVESELSTSQRGGFSGVATVAGSGGNTWLGFGGSGGPTTGTTGTVGGGGGGGILTSNSGSGGVGVVLIEVWL